MGALRCETTIIAAMTSEIARLSGSWSDTRLQFLEKRSSPRWLASYEVRYAKAGSGIIEAGQHNEWHIVSPIRFGSSCALGCVRSLPHGLGQAQTFAYPSLLRGGEVANSTYAIEDTLLTLCQRNVPKATRCHKRHRLRYRCIGR
jgi:hypothetical protein